MHTSHLVALSNGTGTLVLIPVQVRGPAAVPLLKKRVAAEGITTFWRGTYATVVAAAVGHYPW